MLSEESHRLDAELSMWREGRSCVDYAVYVSDLPPCSPKRWNEMAAQMRALGICQDTSFGVTTVRGEWGFFQIPAANFPEMKVTFFQTARVAERIRLLTAIRKIVITNRSSDG